MKTEILVINPDEPDATAMMQAAKVLLAGGLVAFPTETVYGLGANALDASAVRRIYTAKGRPANNPLIAHIASVAQLNDVAVEVPALAGELAAAFWPGPLTMVLKRHPAIPGEVSLGRDTVAVRMPSHPVAQALIEAAGVPVVAPSANRFTWPSATTAQHVLDDLNGRVDLILDGGPTHIGLESTVLDVTSDPPLVLRPGGITLETLRQHIAHVERFQQPVSMDDDTARPASPGMLSRHYAPQAEMLLFSGPVAAVLTQMKAAAAQQKAAGKRVGVLVVDEEARYFEGCSIAPLGSLTDVAQIARGLFSALRTLDEQGVDVIVARLLEPVGLGATINDRLLRAAEGRVIEVEG